MSLEELENLDINQKVEVKGRFARRGELGANYRILLLTPSPHEEDLKSRLFIDHEGEKWTSLDIFNIIEGDPSSWIRFVVK